MINSCQIRIPYIRNVIHSILTLFYPQALDISAPDVMPSLPSGVLGGERLPSGNNHDDSKDKRVSDEGTEEEEEEDSTAKTSAENVLPMDKLKNGAEAAGKFLSSSFSLMKEKTVAAMEAVSKNETVST